MQPVFRRVNTWLGRSQDMFRMVAAVLGIQAGEPKPRVYLGDENINAWMVKQGHAWAYRQYLDDKDYCVWGRPCTRCQKRFVGAASGQPIRPVGVAVGEARSDRPFFRLQQRDRCQLHCVHASTDAGG